MSNLFGGLFQAGQRAKEERVKAKKDEAKKLAREEAAAARAKAKEEEDKKKKAEVKDAKRKKAIEDESDSEVMESAPAKKKAKLSETTPSKKDKSAAKDKKSTKGKKEKRAFLDSGSESGSGDEKDFDSDGSVLEFGSDEETSPELLAQLQDIISGGNVPEVESSEEEEVEEVEEAAEGVVHSVFVGNLLASVSKDDLAKLVSSIAEPVQLRILMQNRDGRQVAVSFIDFATAAAAAKVVSKFNNHEWKGRKLQVRHANDRKLAPAPVACESVHVRNLAFQTTEETIRKSFAPFGEIAQIRLPVFADTGKHRGYGFVDYKDIASAKKALSMDRKKLDGRQILVEPAVKREAPKAEFRPSSRTESRNSVLTFDDSE